MESKTGERKVTPAGLFLFYSSGGAGRTASSELQPQAARQGAGKGSHGFWRQ